MVGQQEKDQAEEWFRDLRDKICKEFEALETDHLQLVPTNDMAPKKFEKRALQEKLRTKEMAVGASWQHLKEVEYLRK